MSMKTWEFSTPNGNLFFEEKDGALQLREYRGRDILVTIPESIEGKTVRVIGKKAFLSAKDIKEIRLPEGIIEVQEWAFACCSNLEVLLFPRRPITFGQGILKDCHKLKRICLAEAALEEDTSFLLAATMNKLDAFYLFDMKEAGSKEWFKQWDARMFFLMEQEDTEGFSKMLLCGEEDYGSKENNLDYYMEQKRREKVRLAMLRLFHDRELTKENRQKLLAYLQAHKKGEPTEETWKVVLEEHGDEKPYYQFLMDMDCITTGNFDAMLEDMGDYHTEMKAFMMNYRNTKLKEDAFAALSFEI